MNIVVENQTIEILHTKRFNCLIGEKYEGALTVGVNSDFSIRFTLETEWGERLSKLVILNLLDDVSKQITNQLLKFLKDNGFNLQQPAQHKFGV